MGKKKIYFIININFFFNIKVQSYVNMNPLLIPSPSSPSGNINNSNCCSSRILIVSEYFIFKCKKIEITVSYIIKLIYKFN
jgi:hypothetical protein